MGHEPRDGEIVGGPRVTPFDNSQLDGLFRVNRNALSYNRTQNLHWLLKNRVLLPVELDGGVSGTGAT